MTDKDLLFFSRVRKKNESLIDTRKRFFKELTEVDEDYAQCHKELKVMFKELNRLCRENNINYFLMGGSCIGAIRAGNPIPWDLDGDIGMLRDDYAKLTSVIQSSAILDLQVVEKFMPINNDPTQDKKDSYISAKLFVRGGSEKIVIDVILWDCILVPDGVAPSIMWDIRNAFRGKYQASETMSRVEGLAKGANEFLSHYANPAGNYIIQAVESYNSYRAVTLARIMPVSMVFPLKTIPFFGEDFLVCNDYMGYIELEWGDIYSIPEFETVKGSRKLELREALYADSQALVRTLGENWADNA